MKVMTSQTCIASPVISQIILPGMRQEEVRNWVDGRFRGFGPMAQRAVGGPAVLLKASHTHKQCQHFFAFQAYLKHAMAASIAMRVWID